jgi:hypothetical protein
VACDPTVHEPDTGWSLARAGHAVTSGVAAALRSQGVSLRGYLVLQAASDDPTRATGGCAW